MVKQNIKLSLLLSASLMLLLSVVLLGVTQLRGVASASTFNVVAGNDGIEVNGQCQLSEAIENINDQAQTHADCPAGTGNDTINLPNGTILLTGEVPLIRRQTSIIGKGTGYTIIDGAGQYIPLQGDFYDDVSGNFVISKVKIINFGEWAVNALNASDMNVSIEEVEIDGSSTPSFSIGGILTAGGHFNISDVYIHDTLSASMGGFSGISVQSAQGKRTVATIKRATISNIETTVGMANAISFVGGILDSSMTSSDIKSSISNSTIENIKSQESLAFGTGALAIVSGSDAIIEYELSNSTISSIEGVDESSGGGLGIVGGGALQPENDVTTNIELSNNILDSCINVEDVASTFGIGSSMGQRTFSLTSQGGNLSNNESCNQYLTHPTDKTNLTNLTSTLGTLSNHGGKVPTIPLLANSPAIDAGITIDDITTDARGISRPQCSAYDSGAYEYNQDCPINPILPNLILNSTDGKSVGMTAPQGTILSSLAAVSPQDIPKDSEVSGYHYPMGLVSFILDDVDEGSSVNAEVFFETELSPSEVKARKYHTTNNTYTDIPDANVTSATYQGKTGLMLSYSITDGGDLDQDQQANGSITDPVGLATIDKPSLLSPGQLIKTGFTVILPTLLSITIVSLAIYTYLDYRKHKKPLQQVDKEMNTSIAKQYTYWHHIRVVTIPLAQYRLSVRIEKRAVVGEQL